MATYCKVLQSAGYPPNVATRNICQGSVTSVILSAVVTATPQPIKCISISFVDFCVRFIYFDLEIIFKLIAPVKY